MSMTMTSPVDRKGKTTKRSSNSYGSEEWKRHRPLITRLYFEEGRTLKEVRDHLEKHYGFSPTERMYKSRLHTWGLDKKKKEHEMLDLVRQGLQQQGEDKDKVFIVRGRQVTLADALHYFNRKGIKDPSSLLESHAEPSFDISSPDDAENQTPLSLQSGAMEHAAVDGCEDDDDDDDEEEEDDDSIRSPLNLRHTRTASPTNPSAPDFSEKCLAALQAALNIPELKPMPAFRTVSVEAVVPSENQSTEDYRYLEGIFQQTQNFYRSIFASRNLTVNIASWTATSDDAAADRFYYSMYHGYSYLWNDQREKAFDNFYKASALIEGLLKEQHVGFLIYILDLVIRHDGSGYEDPLLMILQHLADMAKTVFGSENHPLYLIAVWLKNSTISRAWLAESTLRKLLDFFQDSIGYFHPETIALLQTFATGLMNRRHYKEAAVRFQQLVDAFETIQSDSCYEVCYALRTTSEAFFHMEQYEESLQALKAALDRSGDLARAEEREIYVRCLRAMAEISIKLGRRQEAIEMMQHVVNTCKEAFGPEHPFVGRAKMHLKSIEKGDAAGDPSIPPMVYRLGRGGSAAKYIWISRISPTRLEA